MKKRMAEMAVKGHVTAGASRATVARSGILEGMVAGQLVQGAGKNPVATLRGAGIILETGLACRR